MSATLLDYQLAFTRSLPRRKLSIRFGRAKRNPSAGKVSPAETAIRLLFTGKTLGDELREKLEALVLPVLANAYARGGMKNPDWKFWLRALRDIVESVQPELLLQTQSARNTAIKRGSAAVHSLARQPGGTPGLLRAISELLGREYRKLHQDALDANRPQATRKAASPARPLAGKPGQAGLSNSPEKEASKATAKPGSVPVTPNPVPRAPRKKPEATEDAVSLLADSFRPGAWFKLHRDGDHAARWLKVSQFDSDARTITFANRDGSIADVRDAVAFMRDLARGKAELVHDGDGFERNLNRVIAMTRDIHGREFAGSAVAQKH